MDSAPRMKPEDADKAIQTFFESAMTPEKEDKKEDQDEDENAGVVEGLKCILMKHQIEGLEFLLDHECLDENVKGKGKYGGLLGDDAHPPPPPSTQQPSSFSTVFLSVLLVTLYYLFSITSSNIRWA